MNLPESFLDKMRTLLGRGEYEAYLKALSEKPCYGVRINNKRGSTEHIYELLEKEKLTEKCELQKLEWISNGYRASDTSPLSAHPYYKAGLYYIQEPSAMTTAENIPIEEGDRVLDMCAAPGGKSTQAASGLLRKGFLLANDISASRGKALLKNLEMAGAKNFCVTAEDPKKLVRLYPEYFDKIILDAPCSGEGMFRRDPKGVPAWIEKGPQFYAQIQSELIECAYAMLKPGGNLIYSTCTFDTSENEEQIKALLNAHEDMSVCEIKRHEGFSEGRLGLNNAVRIFPHRMSGEGHFVCLLKKEEREAAGSRKAGPKDNIKNRLKALPKEVSDFLSHVDIDFFKGCFIQEKERIYFLNEDVDKKEGIRYLRTGLFIGTYIKERFEPAGALAMALTKDDFDMSIDFAPEDIDLDKYLKGESLRLETQYKGKEPWRLICVDGFGLGWAKHTGYMLKNKYDAGQIKR